MRVEFHAAGGALAGAANVCNDDEVEVPDGGEEMTVLVLAANVGPREDPRESPCRFNLPSGATTGWIEVGFTE